ncbi:hypothetical protein [Streptomyces sp. NPDC059957]|uniref:hypothetical protein n=1 Tax=unclassified Streptomyces TaxID=2593676 RepID=UPI00364E2952
MTGLTKRLHLQLDHAAGSQMYPRARRISRLAAGWADSGNASKTERRVFALISFR